MNAETGAGIEHGFDLLEHTGYEVFLPTLEVGPGIVAVGFKIEDVADGEKFYAFLARAGRFYGCSARGPGCGEGRRGGRGRDGGPGGKPLYSLLPSALPDLTVFPKNQRRLGEKLWWRIDCTPW